MEFLKNLWYNLVAKKLLIKITKLEWSYNICDSSCDYWKEQTKRYRRLYSDSLQEIERLKILPIDLRCPSEARAFASKIRIADLEKENDNLLRNRKHAMAWFPGQIGDKIPVCKCGSGKSWHLCGE